MAELHSKLAPVGNLPGATLIAPNRRLAAFYKREFDLAQQRSGRMVWPSPDILPYPAWVERTWRALTLRRENITRPHVLDDAQSRLIWEQVIRQSDAAIANGLLNIVQTARQAASAWELAHAWQLLPAMQKMALHDDAAMFLTWTDRYRAICREQKAMDRATLPDALARLISEDVENTGLQGACVLAVGFDITTPQQHRLWRALREADIDFAAIRCERELSRQVGHASRLAFATNDDELRCCADWARQRLERDASQRIAIVVPDLKNLRTRIARELTDALLPGIRARGFDGPEQAALLFNISLGAPLSEHALVRDAIELLSFSVSPFRPIPFLAMVALLRSPYLAGADTERVVRATLDATLRERAAMDIHFVALRKLLAIDAGPNRASQACGVLTDRLERVAKLVESFAVAVSPGNATFASPHDWSRRFGDVLTSWGVPGERALDSVDFQVMAKLRDAFASLAALTTVQPKMSAEEALSQLRRITADTVFQAEVAGDSEAPIQVLGILESAGQAFDAMWVTGLSDDAWPLPVRANPFIPAALQRSAGVTEASAPRSLELDRLITAGWLDRADVVVLSHSMPEGVVTTSQASDSASALIRAIPVTTPAALLGHEMTNRFEAALQALRQCEHIPDGQLAPLPAPTTIRGGATVLRDQSACPFRAFARHRLGAKTLGVPQPGLDAAARGNLLHRVMYLIWDLVPDHDALMDLSPASLAAVAETAATGAIDEARKVGATSLVGRFGDIEKRRLSRLAGDWLEYERKRQPFSVAERESPHRVEFGGLTMDLRLDRLDRLADGTHALIDYKTGIAKLASWMGKRPDEPQLPLYFSTTDREISTLAFARVKRGKTFGFEGLSAVAGLLPDVSPVESSSGWRNQGYASWDVVTQEWEDSLAELAAGFVQGLATVDPKRGGLTCAQCDLHSVCRVAETGVYAALETDAETPTRDDDDE